MYSRILLPLDGSPLAEQALPHAAALAETFQAELILLKVLPPVPGKLHLYREALRIAEELRREMAGMYLDRVALSIQERDKPTQVEIIDGYPHAEIVQFAEKENVDLIVICTRGQSGLSRWLMGSVADRVARGVSVPVLLVRAQKDWDGVE